MPKAPVILFVYNRPEHTSATLRALQRNHGADQSELFVFCDGAKGPDDTRAVQTTRERVRAADGFRAVHLFEQDENHGLAGSIIAGVSRIIADHGRAIVLEDDLVTSPYFLDFMNAGLDRYQHTRRVFSVSGYNLPPHLMRFPARYPHDIYFNVRSSSWGWATWRDRWEEADWDVRAYPSFAADRRAQRAFDEGGEDLSALLAEERSGRRQSWSIRWGFAHFLHKAVALYPVRSYVENIGNDGSGSNCRPNPFMHNDLSRALPTVVLPDRVVVDAEVMRAFRRYYYLRARVAKARRLLQRLLRWTEASR